MASASCVPGKSEESVTPGQLKCPLCLDVYKTPRVLACLHMFCQTCLHGYVMKLAGKGSPMSSIACPVCSKATPSPAPTRPPAEWVTELPIYHFPLPQGSTHDRETLCDNCAFDNKSSPANSFCRDCGQHQCSDCAAAHARFPTMRNHAIVEPTDTTILNLANINEYCQEHAGEKVKFYCNDHEKLLCSRCAFVDHRGCGSVVEVKKLGQDIKSGDRPKHFRNKVKALLQDLSEVTQVLKTNVSEVDQQTDSIVQKMKVVRDRVVKMFDDLVLQVSSKCSQTKEEHSTEVREITASHDSLVAAMEGSLSVLESWLDHGSGTQLFIAINKFDDHARFYEKRVMTSRDNTSTVLVSLALNPALETLLQNTSVLADVTSTRSKVEFDNQSDFVATSIAECKVEKQPMIKIQKRTEPSKHPCYFGSTFLPDGRLVVTDEINNLCCLLDNNCKVIADVKLQSRPDSMATVGESEVAVVLSSSKQIQMVTIATTLKLSMTIPCSRSPKCVARAGDGELAVGWKEGFGIIALDGSQKSYVAADKSGRTIRFSNIDHVAVDTSRSRLYHSHDSVVNCYGLDGEFIFTYNDQLKKARGVALDRDGNVYVCNWKGNNIHQLSPSGTRISIIDTGMDPYSVCFNQAGDQMMTMDYDQTGQALRVTFVSKTL